MEPLEDLNDWEDFPQLAPDVLVLGPERKTVDEIYEARRKGLVSQLGGVPEWAQEPEYPPCLVCGESMDFVGQLSLSDIELEGMVYALLCRDCKQAVTLYQSV